MSGHDAASIVAQLAGAAPAEGAARPVAPSQLIERFCHQQKLETHTYPDSGLVTVRSRGHCGYNGLRGDDLMVTGFDDGYTFMGFLADRGWHPLANKGDWPYVVYLRRPARDGEPETIVEYCEADLTVWQFETEDDAKAFYKTLRDAP